MATQAELEGGCICAVAAGGVVAGRATVAGACCVATEPSVGDDDGEKAKWRVGHGRPGWGGEEGPRGREAPIASARQTGVGERERVLAW